MKSLILPAAIAVLGLTAPANANNAPTPSAALEPINFEVFRNGSRFGQHNVDIETLEDGRIQVDVDIDLNVRLGPISVFRYEHDSQEIWRDDTLLSLEGRTLKDGETLRYSVARASDGTLSVDGEPIPELLPSSHWRGYNDGLSAVLNTETGEQMDVTIEDLGMTLFELNGEMINARHIRMQSTLAVDLWYDEAGRWIGCEFEARGQRIRYERRDA